MRIYGHLAREFAQTGPGQCGGTDVDIGEPGLRVDVFEPSSADSV